MTDALPSTEEVARTAAVPATVLQGETAAEPAAGGSQPARPPKQRPPPPEPNHTLLERRVTVIQEGDQVMLQLPSDVIKVVTAQSKG